MFQLPLVANSLKSKPIFTVSPFTFPVNITYQVFFPNCVWSVFLVHFYKLLGSVSDTTFFFWEHSPLSDCVLNINLHFQINYNCIILLPFLLQHLPSFPFLHCFFWNLWLLFFVIATYTYMCTNMYAQPASVLLVMYMISELTTWNWIAKRPIKGNNKFSLSQKSLVAYSSLSNEGSVRYSPSTIACLFGIVEWSWV